MLSYRHSFHAGNHADVLKHTVQIAIMRSFHNKEKPFLYLDTHSGAGHYRLNSDESEKTGEFLGGIAKLYDRNDCPLLVQEYVDFVRKYNRLRSLRHYPGSPLIAHQYLRMQDSAHFCELHPSDFALLEKNTKDLKGARLKTHYSNGFLQIKALLPPLSRRGLVMIDPSYEMKSDYKKVVKAVFEGYQRFATGIYALWYPVVDRRVIKTLEKNLQMLGIRKILQIELAIKRDTRTKGMTGSGMIVVNPPYYLLEHIEQSLSFLVETLALKTGFYTLKWISLE